MICPVLRASDGRRGNKTRLIRSVIAAATLATLSPLSAMAVPPAQLPSYFPPNSNGLAPMIILRAANAPIDGHQTAATYAYGPLTGVWTGNPQRLSTSTWVSDNPGQEGWVNIWVNRQQSTQYHAPNPNPPNPVGHFLPLIPNLNGQPVGLEYTSFQKANAATSAEIYYSLGAPTSKIQQVLTTAGLAAVQWADAVANPRRYFNHHSQDNSGAMVAIDTFVLPPPVQLGDPPITTNLYAIALDWEPHDNRTIVDSEWFIENVANVVHGYSKKIFLFTNPWDGPLLPSNGFDILTMNAIVNSVDYISNLVYYGASTGGISAEYDYGMKFLTGVSGVLNKNKVIVTYLLDKTNTHDACSIYSRHLRDQFAGYLILANTLSEGGKAPPAPWTDGSANLLLEELFWGRTGQNTRCP